LGKLIENDAETFLTNSGLGVSSNSEYYAILPIEGKDNVCAFYFYTYNNDGRLVKIVINGIVQEGYQLVSPVKPKKEYLRHIFLDKLPVTVEIILVRS